MSEVRLGPEAVEDLDRLILTHSLPADTRSRIRRSLGTLSAFPDWAVRWMSHGLHCDGRSVPGDGC